MEGVSPVCNGVLPTNRLQVPYVVEDQQDFGDNTLREFPQFRGITLTDDIASLGLHFTTSSSLTSFMQSWLFFGLLRTFLRHPIPHTDFVSDGTINLGKQSVEDHFIRWKIELWRASYAMKRQAQYDAEAHISYALAKSEILEETAEALGQPTLEFGLIALSVKLLAGLLLTVLDDTLAKSSGPWAPWAIKSWRRLSRIPDTLAGTAKWTPSFVFDEYTAAMSSRDRMKTLYGNKIMPAPLPSGDVSGGPSARVLLRIFEDNGWCPFRARQLCQTFDYLTLNSIAGLVKRNAAGENHGQCLEVMRCKAHDVIGMDQTVSYPFRHDSQTCDGSCDFIKISYNELASIISSGGKPIISVSMDGPLDLKVIRCTPYTTYTAVSHVWSDGRGNPIENALPQCQIVWLREKIRQTYQAKYNPLYDEQSILRSEIEFAYTQTFRGGRPHSSFDPKRIYFWMDTLCIPSCPESAASDATQTLRLRAIKQITPIFVGAYNALVLDQGLENTVARNPAGLSGDEFASYILGCTWMERGWTLQEGSLVQSCVMQLMDKPYEMSMALRHLMPTMDSTTSPLARAVISIRRATILNLRREFLEHKRQIMLDPWFPRARRFANMLKTPVFIWTWNSLINRSTTRPSDAVLIFAGLLDFDVYQLRSVPQQERLMRVVQGCEVLPLSLLYSTGPKVCIEGHPELSWIPEDIKGDNLVSGPVLRKLESHRANSPVIYSVERGNRDNNTFLTLVVGPGQVIPHGAIPVHIMVHSDSAADNACKEYIVEMQSTDVVWRHETPILGHFIVIDLACGTSSLRGVAGRGASFSIICRRDAQWTVQYDAPLVAEQWIRKTGICPLPAASLVAERWLGRQKIVMTHGE
ncbi:putative AC9 transposase [Purpureocillium lavendulum]|uniref:AC9 transposase n=1 Tax=Purpureocillium lavendulum TaxID=1247861 RepID=A0AB34FC58_9HYPO|nr:putative AC9 transposase [Purpureocillium lavendulum]